MNLYYYIIIIGLLSFSCSQKKHSELTEFPVDINQDISLKLSEITDEITVIHPELTDESLLSYGNGTSIARMIRTENNIIVATSELSVTNTVLVFNKNGKFVRSIGSRGQGPGDHNLISNITFDERNSRLFILSKYPYKIICYHLNGKFVKESQLNQRGWYSDILYDNNELFVECLYRDGKNPKRIVYRMNDNLRVTDSIVCWENNYEQGVMDVYRFPDYVVKNRVSINVYPKELYVKWEAPNVKVLRDTLYRLKDNQLIPELKLKFRNDGIDRYGDKVIDLFNLYRSSRYIFANYVYNPNNRERNTEFPKPSYFCYDTKTGKGYNMLGGYTDDIHGIEERVAIRPLTSDSEYFYYWYTHMNPNDREEPNPTLYIGKLKK